MATKGLPNIPVRDNWVPPIRSRTVQSRDNSVLEQMGTGRLGPASLTETNGILFKLIKSMSS